VDDRTRELVERTDLIMGCLVVAMILAVIARYALDLGWWWIAGGAGAVSLLLCGVVLRMDSDDTDGLEPRQWGDDGERWSMPDPAFDAVANEVEANDGHISPAEASRFGRYVQEAFDELPGEVIEELERNVVIVIADDGTMPEKYGRPDLHGVYGLYFGRTVGYAGARIVIFRDTLTRDFPDHEALRTRVRQTLQHEVAHHLGATEAKVTELGL